ncbi:MAG: hypothetical protein ACOC1K_02510 [Nanoarchaeota archaeon]
MFKVIIKQGENILCESKELTKAEAEDVMNSHYENIKLAEKGELYAASVKDHEGNIVTMPKNIILNSIVIASVIKE